MFVIVQYNNQLPANKHWNNNYMRHQITSAFVQYNDQSSAQSISKKITFNAIAEV